MNRSRFLLFAAVMLPGLLSATVARADDAACIDANESSISLRRDGKLLEALKSLAACTDPSCPADVREACSTRIAKVNEALPSIVFGAKNAAGEDVTDVVVTMDGAPLLTTLDGRPLSLDPGSHTFVFTAKGQPPVERTLVIHEGEKNRQETVRVGPAMTEPPPAPPPPPPSTWTTQRIAGAVIAGVGVVGLGLGGTFGLLASNEQSAEKKDCSSATSCRDPGSAHNEYESATRDATISTVSFIAGGALLAGGAALFFLARTPEQPKPDARPVARTGRFSIAPSIDAHHRGLWLRGEF